MGVCKQSVTLEKSNEMGVGICEYEIKRCLINCESHVLNNKLCT